MKNIIHRILFLVLIFVTMQNYAQSKFNVDYDEIKGKLAQTDKFKADFGRYHGYELPLYEGETANFAVYSNDFKARIILVNPNGKVFKQSGNPTNGFTSLITPIPTSGDWILYVVGDQKDYGNFVLRYAFADQNSINTPSNMDFCSTINFLIAHANAHFMMLQASAALPKLPSSLESFIDNESGAFVNILSSGSEPMIKQEFEDYATLLQNCLPDWKISKNVKKGNAFIQLESKDNIKIVVEYFLNDNKKSDVELILKIFK